MPADIGGNDQDAEDAFQATFLLLARYAGSIRQGQALAGWLYRVAYRTAMKASKDRARRCKYEGQVPAMARDERPSELTWRELQEILREELERLPEKYRAPFVLCCLEEKSKPEAARQLGWKEGTVSSRLAEAKKRLQKRLASRGISLSAVLCTVGLAAGPANAAVPAFLIKTTIKNALLWTSSQAAAAEISTKVLTLAESIGRGLAAAKVRLLAPVLISLGLVAASGGLLAYQGLKPTPEQAKETQPRLPTDQRKNPAAPRKALTDRHGDPLPEGALARLGTTRFRIGSITYGMALAPDGKTAVSVGANNWTQFWNVSTGKELRRLEWKEGGGGRVAAYSPDNRWVATVQDSPVLHIWEAATGKKVAEMNVQMNSCPCMIFSPDSSILAVGGGEYSLKAFAGAGEGNSVVRLWKWSGTDLQPLWEARPDKESPLQGGRWFPGIRSLTFSPDGKYLATGTIKTNIIRVWDVANGNEVRQIKAAGEQIGALAFAPHGKLLASGSDDGTVIFWDPTTGTKLRESKQPGEVRAAAFTPDSKILAVAGGPEYGFDRAKKNEPFLILLDASDGKEIRRLDNVREGVAALGISKDGQVLAAGLGGVIRVWELPSGKELTAEAGHQHWISQVDISEDGKTAVTAGGDGTIILWDLSTGVEKLRLRGHDAEARGVTFIPGGKLLASAGTDQKVRIWDLTTGQQTQQFEGSAKGLTYSVTTSPDGNMVAWGDYFDGTIHIWDLTKSKLVHQVKIGDLEGDGVMHLAFSPSGKLLAVAETAFNAMKIMQFTKGPQEMEARIQLWDATTGKKLREFPAHKLCVTSLAFSPDGRTLASTGSSAKSIRLWDPETGKKLFELPCDSSNGVVRFSPDGKTLGWSNMSGGISLWDMASKKPRRSFQGHISYVHSLAFSPDGRTLVSGSMDATALVWDVTGLRTGTSPVLSEEKMRRLWRALASSDAGEAGRAIWSFTADPKQAVAFLAERLRELPAPDSQKTTKVSQLIADLDSPTFDSREAAARNLRELGKLAVPALNEALVRRSSLDAHRRIEGLLEQRESSIQSSEVLQILRAIEALEHVGTPAARQVLERFASQTAESYFKQEASGAVLRLTKKQPRSSE